MFMRSVAQKTAVIIPLLKSNLTSDDFKSFLSILKISAFSQR